MSLGLGVRVRKGDATGYAHVEDLEFEAMRRAAHTAAQIARAGKPQPESLRKLRALVMFATQASALKEKAVAAHELRLRATMLEEANAKLAEALAEAERARARLDGVLGALASGVMIVGSEGTLLKANVAARALIGGEDEAMLVRMITDGVPRGGEAERVPGHDLRGRLIDVERIEDRDAVDDRLAQAARLARLQGRHPRGVGRDV